MSFTPSMRAAEIVRERAVKALFQKRNRIAAAVRKSFLLDPAEKVWGDPDGSNDPLVTLCNETLPPAVHGKVALYYQEMKEKIPGFSRMMINPIKAIHALERELQNAMEIYPKEPPHKPQWMPGFVFEMKDIYCVYTALGAVSFTSVLVLRTKLKTRFIYTLEDYINSMRGVANE